MWNKKRPAPGMGAGFALGWKRGDRFVIVDGLNGKCEVGGVVYAFVKTFARFPDIIGSRDKYRGFVFIGKMSIPLEMANVGGQVIKIAV